MKKRKFAVATTEQMPRERDRRGDLKLPKYRSLISLSPMLYEKKPGSGFQKISNKADQVRLFNGYIGFDELLTGGFIEVLSKDKPALKVMYGDVSVDITPIGINQVIAEVEYKKDSTFVTYPEAWKNADLQYILSGHLLSKRIYLKKGHPREFKFRVEGADPVEKDGYVFLGGDLAIAQPYLEGKDSIPLKWKLRKAKKGTLFAIKLPEGNWDGWVLDPTIVLQPGAAAGIDTYLDESNLAVNYGGNIHLRNTFSAGGFNRDSMIRWDLSGIPIGSTIDDFTFWLWCNASINTAAWNMHGIIASNDAWTEMGATCFTRDGVNAWTGGGGLNNIPGDNIGVDIQPNPIYEYRRIPAPPVWIAHPNTAPPGGDASNLVAFQQAFDDYHGFYFRGILRNPGANTNLRYDSSDGGVAGQHPALSVTYTPPGGRLTNYTLNVWDPKRRILDRQGRILSPDEVRANTWLGLEGLALPGSRIYPSYVEDPNKLRIVDSHYEDGKPVPDIKTDRNQFGEIITARAAGGKG